jgi:hypothetical protein
MQREIAGPNIDADQLSLIPMTSMIARKVEQSGANSQPGEPSRYNEAAEIDSRIVKISWAIPYQWIRFRLNCHRGHGVCLLFARYGDNPSCPLRQRSLDTVAALPALLVGPVLGPLIRFLAGQPQLRLIDELKDSGQVTVNGTPDVKAQLPLADEAHDYFGYFGHVVRNRSGVLRFRLHSRRASVCSDSSTDVPDSFYRRIRHRWMAPLVISLHSRAD